jgi:hypothetical protein
LNLRPSGKTSFKDFADEKKPTTSNERNVVAVYYMKHLVAIEKVTTDHVFTAYRELRWKLPTDFRNSLQVTASAKGWIDTSDMNDITLTTRGTNAVEQDLPST